MNDHHPSSGDPIRGEPVSADDATRHGAAMQETRMGASGPAAEAPAVPQGRRYGKFTLLEELGSGGMGTVYRAYQEDLKRSVALKVLHGAAGAGSTQVERFLREARAAARLDHPGIVRVFEIGEHDGAQFFSMELIEGWSLSSRMKQDPPPSAERARWIRDAARAVHHAHGHGIVHRDIKPQNILVAGDGAVKVADFGLARDTAAGPRLTMSGETLGTPWYMSPEQAAGRLDHTGPLSDVYSLGATLYELVSGKSPVEGANLAQVLGRVAAGEITPLRDAAPNVPRDLETIIMRSLSFDPLRRYPTAAALADDIDRFLKFEAIEARPESWWERRARFVRRHRRAILTGAAVLALLAASGGWGWRELDRRLGRAAAEAEAAKRRGEAMDLVKRAGNADAVMARGGVPEQLRILRQAVEHAPDLAEAHFCLAVASEEIGDVAGALAEYERALQRDPAMKRAAARLAYLLLHHRGSSPEHRAAMARGREMVDRLLASDPGDPHVRLAAVFRDTLDAEPVPADAVGRLEGIVAEAPEARLLIAAWNGAYFHPLATRSWDMWLAERDPDRAFIEITEYCAREPLSVSGRMNLGLLRYEFGDFRGAERDFRFARDNAPAWSEPAYYLGRALFVLQRYAEAEAQFRAAVALRASDQKLNALALALMMQRRHEEALEFVRAAAAEDPDDALASLLQPLLHLCLGDEKGAAPFLERLGGRTTATIEQLRTLDADLSRPEMALLVSAIRTRLTEFQDVMFQAPEEKEEVCKALATVLRLPQVQAALKQYGSKSRLDKEIEEVLLNLPRIEREAPEVLSAARGLFRMAGIKADPHIISVLAQFGAKIARDAALQKRTTLLTADDFVWRAGIHYREARVTKDAARRAEKDAAARADLEAALRLDRTSGRIWWAMATVLARLGEFDRCADALRQARAFGWDHVAWAQKDDDFKGARKAEVVVKALEESGK